MASLDKRTAILDALERVLKNRRYDEVTIDAVAQAAKVGKGTVYRYFQDKQDLFFQMVQNSLQNETDAVMAVAVSALDPLEKLVRMAECMSEHIRRNHTSIRMMHEPSFARRQSGAREIMQAHHERLNRILMQVLQDAGGRGALRGDLDLEQALCLYKGMIMERTLRLMRSHAEAELPLDELVKLLVSGLGPAD